MQQQNSGVDFSQLKKTKTDMLQFITSTLRVIGVIWETLNFCFLRFLNKLKSLIADSRLTNKRV